MRPSGSDLCGRMWTWFITNWPFEKSKARNAVVVIRV